LSGVTPAHLDHSRDWRDFDYCYPVISRRSGGLSLGVNINLDKACNFDCVYCEVCRRHPPRRKDVDLDQLEREMRALLDMALSGGLFATEPVAKPAGFATGRRHRLRPAAAGSGVSDRKQTRYDTQPETADGREQTRSRGFETTSTGREGPRLNDMAFSGDGEPTTAAEFPAAVSRLAGLRKDHGLQDLKIVLITNSTMLQAPSVVGALDEMMENGGEIWAKLDSGLEGRYRAVNRSNIPLGDIQANLAFAGGRWPLVIQTMFLEWQGRPPLDDELAAYADTIGRLLDAGIKLQGLHLYTVARPTPEPGARPLPSAAIDRIAEYVKGRLPGVSVDVFYGPVA